ncbi:MAG TPA: nuclear transport factor 2 family protein [Rhizomicrobium sp.]
MKFLAAIAISALMASACAAQAAESSPNCAAVSTPNQKLDEDTIQRIEEGWITAEYRGNTQFLECLLEPDYRTSGKSGQIRTRQDVIDHVPQTTDMSKPVPQLQTIVFIHGTSATAHSIMHSKDKDGNPKEVHFVDGYTFHDGRWFAYSGADF